MLRENMEQQKERELNLQREKKMLLLSLSHDIKTPLSAIKLYSKALSKGLYTDKENSLKLPKASMPKPMKSRDMLLKSSLLQERTF